MIKREGNRKGFDGNRKGIYAGGVDIAIKTNDLAKEFITAAEDVFAAMSRTIFDSQEQLNSVVALARKLIKWEITEGLETLLMWLNGKPSVGGFNRALAAMIAAGIIAPEAMGVRLSKDNMRFMREQIEAKAKARQEYQEVRAHKEIKFMVMWSFCPL